MTDFDARAMKIAIERCAHPNRIRNAKNCCVGLSADIAAALKAAYNEGLEDAAWAMETEKDEPWHASFIRRKKVPV